nr:DUF2779 domain-containing protein [uncultured Rhodoferax sp.]
MRILSKSKLLAFRQCPKRLWLEVHQPELRSDSNATETSFLVGNQVGSIARKIYDPKGKGALVNPQDEGFDAAFARSQALLRSAQPIFEAGFNAEGALAFADVMLPARKGGQRVWRMVEVKSSTSVEDYHRDDVAVQAFVAKAAGVSLSTISLAHIDSTWIYPGNGDYQGLLVESDLTDETFEREDEVRAWISQAQKVIARRKAPSTSMGKQCEKPYECGFLAHCQSEEPQVEYPIQWLPGRPGNALATYLEKHGVVDLRDAPDALLTELQLRVKKATLSARPYFDKRRARLALAEHKLPAYFMDFESVQCAVPVWKATRPYQQIPFQFSVHRLSRTGKLAHRDFLDLSGKDPSKEFAVALIAACGEQGPIFVYNASFEAARIRELADRFKRLATPLMALVDRIVDLLPIARAHYYHPSQKGSWSIKVVLPALCPDQRYSDLDGVQDGGKAVAVFFEAIDVQTTAPRKEEIESQLLAYCKLDTYAMVRIWSKFTGVALKD